ncbi:MAG: S8 family serine peptidase [Thermoleophilia bacterium]|nr:S8 family serine peptidase [Thermoleophilia bacterium]
MRARLRPSGQPHLALLVVVAVAATLLAAGLAATRGEGGEELRREAELPPSAWYGFVGAPPVPVPVGQRVIVVLDVPSLAQRVAAAGGRAPEMQHRRWTAAVFAAQRQLVADLAEKGIRVRPDYQYARVISGFSAALDARAVAVLERTRGVAGVYPVRVAYPAQATGRFGRTQSSAPVRLPGATGRGVTIALLDTGVERTHRFVNGRVRPGIDVLAADGSPADAESRPGDPRDVERHGTQLAGILVGGAPDSPVAAHGLAPGARVLPIRVAGWQPDARGGWTVYGRTDQLIAGLERAVDPNADLDAHDAARIAVVGVVQPYAAFSDSPDAAAVEGALALDTLVVTPAGNDGPAGPRYGSIAGPGASAAALTVGAAEQRGSGRMAAVALRVGLDTVFDGVVPLAGDFAADEPLSLALAAPLEQPAAAGSPQSEATLVSFFDDRGFSVVAGRAALVPAGAAPERAAAAAVDAGARAVVLYGGRVPSGALDLGRTAAVPVVGVPELAGRSLLEAVRRGSGPRVTLAPAGAAAIEGGVAPFSSRGLAFDGRLKPDVVAPGVALLTSEPGENEDASPRYTTLSGASAAAGVAGAAAALLAEARPDLDAAELKGALVGAARPLAGEARTAQGAGLLDVGAAAASELAAEPSTLAFHRSRTSMWREGQSFVVRNVSTRPLRVSLHASVDGEPEGVSLRVYPARFRLKPRRAARVYIDARAHRGASEEVLSGAVEIRAAGVVALRVPWAASPAAREQGLVTAVGLTKERFEPSDRAPSVLAFTAGRLVRSEGHYEVQAVGRLDLEVRRVGAKESLGLLARLRHLLPGRYAFGLTGRGPGGKVLRPGRYELRLIAYPTGADPPTRRTLRFTVT